MLSLDQTNFTSVINRQDRPVVVKFYADWCKDCRAIKKPAAELAEQYAEAFTFAELDTMVAPEIRDTHLVRGIPTFIAFWRGNEIARIPASDSAHKEVRSREELEAFLQELLWKPRF
jgi:thioredoxin-like negative regulator of GroEL